MPFNYRDVVIQDDKSIGKSGTDIINLNLTDPITSLLVRFKIKNGASIVDDTPPEESIDKIEIIDGGQTYMSLTGVEAVAAHCFDAGKWPHVWYAETAAYNQRANINLLFGRYIGDQQFAFDPRKLRNPQLRFTWSNDSDYDDDNDTLGVVAKVMQGVSAPNKCLFWRGIESFTTAGSGDKRIELPVDHDFRRMMIRAYLSGYQPRHLLNHYKLDCDVGKLIPFDLDNAEWEDLLEDDFGPFHNRLLVMVDNNGSKQLWMSGKTVCNIGHNQEFILLAAASSANNYTLTKAYNTQSGGTANNIGAVLDVWGHFPHDTWCYQFGLKDDPATWFKPQQFGGVNLYLTQGHTGGAASVILQQPRTLP